MPTTAIIGLGKTGYSCVEFLKGEDLVVLDTRESPPLLSALQSHYPDVEFHATISEDKLLSAERIIVSPGLSLETAEIKRARAAGKEIIGDVELFARHVNAPVIAITGTNAKSTVTTLIGNMLLDAGKNVKVGGNLGEPVLSLLTSPAPDYYVLELSSFQLETTYSLKPFIATILNVSEDHMDRYTDFKAYISAKKRIYQHAKNVMINADDLNTYVEHPHAYRFSVNQISKKHEEMMQDMPLRGLHHKANALAALTVGEILQLDEASMKHTLNHFKGLSHRAEFVREHQGITWINDSKGTNIGATLAALAGLKAVIQGKMILLLGGADKGSDFSILNSVVDESVREIILFGRDGSLIDKQLQCERQVVETIQDAVKQAGRIAQPGDCVLFSPACTSWDAFENFAERGDYFKQLVLAM